MWNISWINLERLINPTGVVLVSCIGNKRDVISVIAIATDVCPYKSAIHSQLFSPSCGTLTLLNRTHVAKVSKRYLHYRWSWTPARHLRTPL